MVLLLDFGGSLPFLVHVPTSRFSWPHPNTRVVASRDSCPTTALRQWHSGLMRSQFLRYPGPRSVPGTHYRLHLAVGCTTPRQGGPCWPSKFAISIPCPSRAAWWGFPCSWLLDKCSLWWTGCYGELWCRWPVGRCPTKHGGSSKLAIRFPARDAIDWAVRNDFIGRLCVPVEVRSGGQSIYKYQVYGGFLKLGPQIIPFD